MLSLRAPVKPGQVQPTDNAQGPNSTEFVDVCWLTIECGGGYISVQLHFGGMAFFGEVRLLGCGFVWGW